MPTWLLWPVANWRLIVVFLGAAAIGFTLVYIRILQLEKNEWKHKAETVLQINRQNAVELDNLRKSNEINQKILKDQMARKAKQEKELSQLTKDILSDDSSKDCPPSQSVINLLNGLRKSDSPDQD